MQKWATFQQKILEFISPSYHTGPMMKVSFKNSLFSILFILTPFFADKIIKDVSRTFPDTDFYAREEKYGEYKSSLNFLLKSPVKKKQSNSFVQCSEGIFYY